MKFVYILSIIAGAAVTAYAGGHSALTPALRAELVQFAAAAAFTGLHVFIWSRAHWVFKAGRLAIWLGYFALAALFVAAYFPHGILPVLLLIASSIKLPVAMGFASVTVPALLGRRRTPAAAEA